MLNYLVFFKGLSYVSTFNTLKSKFLSKLTEAEPSLFQTRAINACTIASHHSRLSNFFFLKFHLVSIPV